MLDLKKLAGLTAAALMASAVSASAAVGPVIAVTAWCRPADAEA
jgi:hypothetical protein